MLGPALAVAKTVPRMRMSLKDVAVLFLDLRVPYVHIRLIPSMARHPRHAGTYAVAIT